MFKLDSTNHFVISNGLETVLFICIAIVGVYFFSYNIQYVFGKIVSKVSKKIGTFAVDRDYRLQRYIYQHRNSPISKLYNWINQQLIALGLKRQGVTPTGYLIFWSFAAILLGTIIGFLTKSGVLFTLTLWVLCFIMMLILTRVFVSERLERREADVMDAIDLIIPEAGNGIKNAIASYADNFAPSIRADFKAFLTNVNERGYSFEDAMIILTDSLGTVFRDFAQKAVYYERVGEKEMLDIFSDITETNRLRRDLRTENTVAFLTLKSSFIVSVFITFLYFIFIITTDEFSRTFFLQTSAGKVILVIILCVVFLVLSYITTIKSRDI